MKPVCVDLKNESKIYFSLFFLVLGVIVDIMLLYPSMGSEALC